MVGGYFDHSVAKAKRKIIKSSQKRVILFLLLLCMAASFKSFIFIGVVSIIVLILLFWSGIKWKYILLRMLLLIPFGLGAIILLPFTMEGREVSLLFGLAISREGLDIALLLIYKLLVCHFIICLLLSTTAPHELFQTLRRLGVPFVLIEIIKITMRYLAVLFEEIERMMIAQQARGFAFKTFTSWNSYKRTGELLGVLLIRSYYRSNRIHEAMISRGFSPTKKE